MRKALKNLIVLPLAWSLLALLGSFLFIISFLPKSFGGRYYHYLGRLWCRLFVRGLDVELALVHRNRLPLPDHYILIANHPSAFEDFGLPALFDIYPLAKSGVRHWFLLGRISMFADVIFVEREDADSRQMALQSLLDAARSGKNMAIFPEGGCKGRYIHDRFHTGAFDVSLQTGVPIVPVFLHYVDQDTFEWTDQTLLQKLWQIFLTNNNRVYYYVYDAIDPAQFDDKYAYAEYAHKLFLQWQQEILC